MLGQQGLRLRAALFRSLRAFFHGQEFLEVDTPVLLPQSIPESNILPIPAKTGYLQTSPEQCMKRLLAAGSRNIFQICPCFRQEERGRYHLEQFTMLEWYRAGDDYRQLMTDCERLLQWVAADLAPLLSATAAPFWDVDLTRSERLEVSEAFVRYAGTPVDRALATGMFDQLLVEQIEPQLGRSGPTFLVDYPVACGSLARRKRQDERLVERFELYLLGTELANGFSELTDPEEQRHRFQQEQQEMMAAGRQPGPLPERFLEDLAGLDEAAGIALGVDRLLMLLTGSRSITEVVTFSPDDF